MKISNLRKENRGEEIHLVADVENTRYETEGSKENTIWVSVPREFEEYLTDDCYDGFLVALLYPAMTYGEDIEIDGAVSKRLMRNINKFIQEILATYNHKLKRITITVKEVTGAPLTSTTHIGTGFSGGVDSFSTIYDNYVLEQDPEYKIDTLVCLNVGSHGMFGDERTGKLFSSRCAFLKRYAAIVNLPFIAVNSNIHYYHKLGHFHTAVLTQISGFLTIQKMIKKFYIASVGWNYDQWIKEAANQRNRNIEEFAEPYLLPLFSTETTEFILDGIQYTRVQKTLAISNYPLTRQFLNVCLRNEPNDKNCGECLKCARVGLTLSTVDRLDEYKDVFDISAYKKSEYMLMCMAVDQYKSNPFMSDIVNLGGEHGKKYPSSGVVFIRITLMRLLKKIVKGLARLFRMESMLRRFMRWWRVQH